MPFVCGLVSCLGLIFAVIRTAPAHTKAALSLGTPLPPRGPAPRRGHICAEVALPSGRRTGRVQTASGNKKCQVVLTSRPAEPRGWDPHHTGLSPPRPISRPSTEHHRAWGGGAWGEWLDGTLAQRGALRRGPGIMYLNRETVTSREGRCQSEQWVPGKAGKGRGVTVAGQAEGLPSSACVHATGCQLREGFRRGEAERGLSSQAPRSGSWTLRSDALSHGSNGHYGARPEGSPSLILSYWSL